MPQDGKCPWGEVLEAHGGQDPFERYAAKNSFDLGNETDSLQHFEALDALFGDAMSLLSKAETKRALAPPALA
jgi:hypothetical protein